MIGKYSIHSQIYDLEHKLRDIQNAANTHDVITKLGYLEQIKRGELDYLQDEEINKVLRNYRIYVHERKKK